MVTLKFKFLEIRNDDRAVIQRAVWQQCDSNVTSKIIYHLTTTLYRSSSTHMHTQHTTTTCIWHLPQRRESGLWSRNNFFQSFFFFPGFQNLHLFLSCRSALRILCWAFLLHCVNRLIMRTSSVLLLAAVCLVCLHLSDGEFETSEPSVVDASWISSKKTFTILLLSLTI